MVKEKKFVILQKVPYLKLFLFSTSAVLFLLVVTLISAFYFFERNYQSKVYPGVKVDGVAVGGKTPQEIEIYYREKGIPFKNLSISLSFEDKTATLSASELSIAYDEKLLSTQAYLIGRSGNLLSDTYQKWKAAIAGINLSSILKINTEYIDEILSHLSQSIDVAASDALFQFDDGKVTVFQISKEGRQLDIVESKEEILRLIASVEKQTYHDNPTEFNIQLPVKPLLPRITTENSNNFGIRELLGVGSSTFRGSIPGRVHNVILAAKKLNGHLMPPGTTFSFNETLGDVSASTGFQPAYIIKDGRTVLGDGGGVCQVSTTIFRAALYSGLPIIERHAHAYRVSYYEQDSGPGLDATVFAPGYDLKFKNDTSNYILIQTKANAQNYTLIFEFYGTSDGRKVEVTKPVILSQTAPPPDLYQDDPTLPKGVVKQVDWKAWGAKVNFDYKVVRNNEVMVQEKFFSNYRPWQSVYLRGIM